MVGIGLLSIFWYSYMGTTIAITQASILLIEAPEVSRAKDLQILFVWPMQECADKLESYDIHKSPKPQTP